jgi:hypothetical protein
MSKDREIRRMRMDMLRVRAPLERAELTSAAHALREDASRMRTAATTLKGMGALVRTLSGLGGRDAGLRAGLGDIAASLAGRRGSGTAGGFAATVIDQFMRRPWLAAVALKGLRSAKRHPGIAVAAVVGVVAATAIARRRRDPSEDMFSAPMA